MNKTSLQTQQLKRKGTSNRLHIRQTIYSKEITMNKKFYK